MIGVISDIHGNLPALEAVLEAMGEVSTILCAGDIVGYNPYPREVIDMVISRGIVCIRGNHDRAVLGEDYSRFNPYAAAAARWTRRQLDSRYLSFLESLPDSKILRVEGMKIAIHHGSPWDEDMYVYPDMVTEEYLRFDNPDILVLGHTHVPFIKKSPSGIVLNPGSVGQPRDGDWRASYAIIDGDEVRIHRVEYDVDEVYMRILDTNLPEFLGERLYSGI